MTFWPKVKAFIVGFRPWVKRGTWAVIDQGLFAGTNFIVSILLARWLEPAAYGGFASAYSIFSLVGTFHTALWTEPMLVYGAGRYRQSFGPYQRILLYYHWRFSIILAAGLALTGGVFWMIGSRLLACAFFGLAVGAPLILYLWLMRRSAYVFLVPNLAVYGGALYLITYIGAALILQSVGLLTEGTALAAMGLTALPAGVLIGRRVLTQHGSTGLLMRSEVRKLHWSYGRWALIAGGLSWVPGNIYYIILPAMHNLEAAGVFKALFNLVMPILHFNAAIAGLFVPTFVRAKEQGRLRPATVRALWVQVVPALGFWAFLVAAGPWVMRLLYNERYQETYLLAWFGLVSMTAAITGVFGAVIRALERPALVAQIYAVTACLSATLGVAFTYLWGLRGAIAGMLVVNVISALLFMSFGLRLTRYRCESPM